MDKEMVFPGSVYKVLGDTPKVVHGKGADNLNLCKNRLSRAESLLVPVTREVESSAHTTDKLGTPHGVTKSLDS